MACKVVFFYNQGAQGWTETYYTTAATPLGFFAQQPDKLYQRCIELRAPGTVLFAVRASVVDTLPRVSITKFFGDTYVVPPQSGDDKQPDIVGTDALLSLKTSDLKQRKLYLRGLNDFNTLRAASFVSKPSGILIGQIKLMITQLRAFGLCIRFGKRFPAAGIVPYSVYSIKPFGLNINNSEIIINGTPTWGSGEQVLFEGTPRNDLPGFPRLATLNGPAVPIAPGAQSTIYISYRYRASAPITYPSTMKVMLNQYTYEQINDYEFESFSEHKVGRAFGVPRGRARAAVKAR